MGLCAQVSLQFLNYADNLGGDFDGRINLLAKFSRISSVFVLHACYAQYHELTWICARHRDSMQTFEELSDIFSDHNNYLTSRELLMRVSPNSFSCFISKAFLKIWNSKVCILKCVDVLSTDLRLDLDLLARISRTETIFLFVPQEGTSKFASLESCAKEHQKRTHKRLQLQREMVRQRLAN